MLWVFLPKEGRRDDFVLICNRTEIEGRVHLGDVIPAFTGMAPYTLGMLVGRMSERRFRSSSVRRKPALSSLGMCSPLERLTRALMFGPPCTQLSTLARRGGSI